MRVIEHQTTVSTNADALALAHAGEHGPLWVMAHEQTGGRGRSGRKWEGCDGNLFASFLINLTCSPQVASQVSLVAGVAMADAIQRLIAATGSSPALLSDLRLKWPNDIFVGSAKLGGILVEASTVATGEPDTRAIVIGFGLNLAVAPKGLDRETTALAALGLTVTARDMLTHLDAALLAALDLWNLGTGFSAIQTQWMALAGPKGARITVQQSPDQKIEGKFVGLDPDGALLLSDDQGTLHKITFGDVELLG